MLRGCAMPTMRIIYRVDGDVFALAAHYGQPRQSDHETNYLSSRDRVPAEPLLTGKRSIFMTCAAEVETEFPSQQSCQNASAFALC